MKTKLSLLLFACVFSLAGQTIESPEMPFYKKASFTAFYQKNNTADTLWLPVTERSYYHAENETLFGRYEYNEKGLLQKYVSSYKDVRYERIYNQTYITPKEDVLDTFTTYRSDIPQFRYVYDNKQGAAQNRYFGEEYQVFENGEWASKSRVEWYFMDTLTVQNFRYKALFYDEIGKLTSSSCFYSLSFDDRGNVIEAVLNQYDPSNGQFYIYAKIAYSYDDQNICYEWHNYLWHNNDWQVANKSTDIVWREFYGFNDGVPLVITLIGRFINEGQNQRTSFNHWSYGNCSGGAYEWTWDGKEVREWNQPGENKYMRRWNYSYSESIEDIYLEVDEGLYYDQYDNREKEYITIYNPPVDGTLSIDVYGMDSLANHYDSRGRFYLYERYRASYDSSEDPYIPDLELAISSQVDSFTYVANPVGIDEIALKEKASLQVVPNPSDGNFSVISQKEIAEIQIYSISGVKLYNKVHSGKSVNLHVANLPQGVYLLQARFKDQTTKTEKIFVQ